MRLMILFTLLFVALTPDEGPIVLFEEGLSYSKIRSEHAGSMEEQLVGSPFDRLGNYYTIESDQDEADSRSGQVIKKHTSSGRESVFAKLNVSDGVEARFEALTFDRSGNMIVAVLVGKETPHSFWERRDYYLIEGMPEPEYVNRLRFMLGIIVLLFVLVSAYRRFVMLRFRKSLPLA